MNHVLFGAALPLAVCVVIWLARGRRAGRGLLVGGPLAMLASGMVAVIPDLPRLWGDQVLYVAWHHRRWCDLCWGHCWIDRRDGFDSWPGWSVLFVVFGVLLFAGAWRELRRAEDRAWPT